MQNALSAEIKQCKVKWSLLIEESFVQYRTRIRGQFVRTIYRLCIDTTFMTYSWCVNGKYGRIAYRNTNVYNLRTGLFKQMTTLHGLLKKSR